MLLSAVSVLVVAQSSSEIPEGLMNNPVQSVHYRTINTTYVAEPKILHYSVHVLQSNIQIIMLHSYTYVHISVR